MTISTSRRFGWTSLCAFLVAAIASVALAGSASASPDSAVNIDMPGHTAQFGTNCQAGDPADDASMDWQEDAAKTTIAVKLTGDLCLQSTKDTYRVVLEYYYRDPHLPASSDHVKIASVASRPTTGNNGALNTSSVTLTGPRVLSAAVHHAHVQIQVQDASGKWSNFGGFSSADY